MDALIPTNLPWLATYLIIAVILGYFVGSRHSRKQMRDMLRDFNQQSLDMLDVKSNHAKLSKFIGQSERKDRVLKLTLKQLTAAKARIKELEQRINDVERKHYIKTSRLRLLASHSTDKARRAHAIAVRATEHIKLLERRQAAHKNAPSTAKSYSQSATAPVQVVDQQTSKATDNVLRVPQSEAARFTRLRTRNEGSRFNSANLQAIDGICPKVEKKLNQAGIHRVEQLANMSDSDIAALSLLVSGKNHDMQEKYTAAWKGGAQRLLRK